MAAHQTYSYDVLVIGAGGAGLRAAIEAANAGVTVGLICKSLLGKAHTVMAEGGMAAAMGHNDDRDNWKVHFADTMRGGQYVNNWRMAEIHAREAPDRVRELEAWGAVFDRTPDGRINQRNFGGHRYPRLAHVGDRTGLELIRTLQDHTTYLGVTVHMEHTVIELILDGGRASGVVAYDRERGRFHVFNAKAVVLATGGVGRAFKITSNSWEGTGDGHALAYRAGAQMIDMEFIQFHPTGMVWPPSVRGILVTEGVRGEGGVLRNSEGRRFMFDDIPDNYKPQTASDPEEGWRYTQGDKSARRPPELLTRDHVARAINREVKAGRGSPHGGVFLDIAWIKEKKSDAEAHIKRKLPSMYHQFKELADLDITKEPMEVGPTTHYIMGGIRVDADTQESTIPGLFAAGECAAGINGANRLGGNSLSDLIVFGKLAGEYAAQYAKKAVTTKVDEAAVERAIKESLAPFERGAKGENPYKVQQDLQDTMQELVGIVRTESEMQEAVKRLAAFRERASRVGVEGHREFNSGWHTCIDLRNLLDCSELIAVSAIERKESRGGHFRDDYPEKAAEFGTFNIATQLVERPRASVAGAPEGAAAGIEADHRGAKAVSRATFRIWRSEPGGASGGFKDYTTEISDGMVVLDAVHKIQAEQAPDLACRWNCKAGKCGSCSAEINGKPRLMCMSRLNSINLDEPVTVEPLRTFPLVKDLVTDVSWNFRVKKGIKKFKPRKPDAPDGTWRMFQKDIDRVQEFRKCIECFLCQDVCHVLRDHDKHEEFIGPRFFVYVAALEMHPLDVEDRLADLKDKDNIGYCNITKCCTKVCPEHITITDNAIIPLKERVVDRFYDPLTRLLRMVRWQLTVDGWQLSWKFELSFRASCPCGVLRRAVSACSG